MDANFSVSFFNPDQIVTYLSLVLEGACQEFAPRILLHSAISSRTLEDQPQTSL